MKKSIKINIIIIILGIIFAAIGYYFLEYHLIAKIIFIVGIFLVITPYLKDFYDKKQKINKK